MLHFLVLFLLAIILKVVVFQYLINLQAVYYLEIHQSFDVKQHTSCKEI